MGQRLKKMGAPVKNFIEAMPVHQDALLWLAGARALQNDKSPQWMKAMRAAAGEIFAGTGLPKPNAEGWQYTSLRDLKADKFHYHVEPVKFDAQKLPAPYLENAGRIVLVNGQYQQALSDIPAGVEFTVLANAGMGDVENHLVTVGDLGAEPFKALNAAHTRDGFVLKVAKGKDIETPIEVLFYTTNGAAAYPRVAYVMGENSGLRVIERFAGEGEYLTCAYAGISLEPAARLSFNRFVEEAPNAFHLSHTVVRQQKNSVFEGFSGGLGGRLVRQDLRMQLLDAHVSANIGGIYLLKDQALHDFTVLADHFEPDGTSVQHFKGVIDDQARAVFQGKIYVHRPAQKTDGYQSHHALLLSNRAEANAKPELEIYADDVKCSHGATAGQLDAEALFYLRSRGIPETEARALLIHSFLAGALERVTFAPAKEIYLSHIEKYLQGRG